MRKTKILVTLGPSAEQEDVLLRLLDAGMNVARLNFSHGDYEEHGRRIERIHRIRRELGRPLAMMLDTKGPEIRAGNVENGSITLETGSTLILTTRQVLGTPACLSVSYGQLPRLVRPGNTILLDDGLIELDVLEIPNETEMLCRVKNGGRIKDKRGINVPRLQLDLPNPTPKDEADIRFAAANDFDFIAVSFTESLGTIERVRAILDEENASHIKIIAKIENHAGLGNFDTILGAADGIMVARGDLGVEMAPEEVPIVQKEIIRKCYMAGKPVITATQMLHTMIDNPRPTRAEVSDVANAIYDFTSAIMLSGETSVGAYPVQCVETMDRIARRAEEAIDYKRLFFSHPAHHQILSDAPASNAQSMALFGYDESVACTTAAVTNAAITTAYNVGARAVITVSESGRTAQMLSRLRSSIPLIAVVWDEHVYRQLSINWGVTPVLGQKYKTLEDLHREAVRLAMETGLVKKGDPVVLVAGVPVGHTGATNMIKVEIIGETDQARRGSERRHLSLVSNTGVAVAQGGTPNLAAVRAVLDPHLAQSERAPFDFSSLTLAG